MKTTESENRKKEIKHMLGTTIDMELTRANKVHGRFNSLHEGIAVLWEEVEEFQTDLGVLINEIKCLWMYIKTDSDVLAAIPQAEKTAMAALYEFIQVCAMIRKFKGA